MIPSRADAHGSAGDLAPAAYPMVDERHASGRVAAVYAQVLERLPMVPSVFKSLAVCPDYLVLAWDQARGILDDERFSAAADDLVGAAAGAVATPDDRVVRELLARFVDPVARMLLVTAGLRLALDGALPGPPATATTAARVERRRPVLDVPPTAELDAELVGAIRRDLATPIVNSVWRVAADRDLLAPAWAHLAPLTRTRRFSDAARRLEARATTAARRLEWPLVASPTALQQHGIADAAAGVGAILDAYLATLPRVLALVASSGGHEL